MKRIVVLLFAFLFVITFTSSFSIALSSSGEITWARYSGNPLDLGLDRVVEPWVIYDGLMFKMWYTGITDHSGIYYATSLDGVNWTPYGMVLDIGESGSWEGLAVGRPVVLFDGVIYKMWYMGYDGFAHRIGYATSMDGINWIKCEANPVLVPGGNGGWDDWSLGEFTVTFDGALYRMWYNGQAYMYVTLKIGVATSPDGISWTKYAHNPVLVPGSSGWDSYHIYTGPVIKKESSYLMWYSGQQSSTVRVGLATSPDGFSWTKQSGNPVLDVGPPETWDSAYIFAMSVVKKADRLLMWYWGASDHTGGTERIGLATSHAIAEVDIDPDTLNLKSHGEWISCYIELPEDYSVENIEVSTILLNDTIGVDSEAPTQIGDYDSDGTEDLMVKFDRAEIIEWLGTGDYGEDTEKSVEVTLTITGEVMGVEPSPFEGSDSVKVLLKG